MKRSTQLGSAWVFSRGAMLAGAICVVLLVTGCAERRAKAKVFPWDIVANLHPLIPEAPDAPEATEAAVDDVGSPLLTEIASPPSPLIAARSAPARPRLPPGPAASAEAASRPDVPQIAPQLTAAETAAAQQQTNQSLTVAGRNLEAIQGRNLNGTQTDLASKIRSFIAEAREAAQIGDWTRARNAAKKAEVLSQELASSL